MKYPIISIVIPHIVSSLSAFAIGFYVGRRSVAKQVIKKIESIMSDIKTRIEKIKVK